MPGNEFTLLPYSIHFQCGGCLLFKNTVVILAGIVCY